MYDFLKDKGILPAECKQIADLILFLDNIFDSINDSKTKFFNAKPLLGPATPSLCTIKYGQRQKLCLIQLNFCQAVEK